MALMERPDGLKGGDRDFTAGARALDLDLDFLHAVLGRVAAAVSAARCAANGVLLRLPLKPTVPAEAQHNVSPLGSVIVTIVLLNVALMWTMPG